MRWIVAGTHSLDSTARVSTWYLVRHLADRRGDEVLYLPAPVSPLHTIARRGDLRFRERRPWTGSEPRPAAPRVLQYTPRTLLPALARFPFDGVSALRHSLRATWPSLRRVVERAGFIDPDGLFVSNLQYAWLDEIVRPERLVYRCVDDIMGFSGAPMSLASGELALLRRADFTFASAADLASRLQARGARRVVTIPNGVDVERFTSVGANSPEANEAAAPADLRAVARPRVVFCGTINERFHADWVRTAAERMPHVRFVILGPWEKDDEPLRRLPNLHPLGPVAPERVPLYLAACDAAIIPFRLSPLVEATCPIKLFEYMAAGLPVVATLWPEIERLASPASLVSRSEEFVAALERALAHPGDPENRIAWARDNAWDLRFGELMREIGTPDPPAKGNNSCRV